MGPYLRVSLGSRGLTCIRTPGFFGGRKEDCEQPKGTLATFRDQAGLASNPKGQRLGKPSPRPLRSGLGPSTLTVLQSHLVGKVCPGAPVTPSPRLLQGPS